MEHQSSNTGALVRQEVRKLLEASPAFHRLPEESRRKLAEDTVRVAEYLAEPEGIRANGLAGAMGAVPAEGAAARDLLADVNFPAFVSALIEGVFQSIVNASVEQMRAYGELVAGVVKTLDQFASDATSDGAARDWLARTYADCFERDSKTGKLRLRAGVDCAGALPRLRLLTGQRSLGKLAPEQIEAELVPAARRRLAAGRQQTLATMTLMGINRIVVTDGKITGR